MRTSLEHLRPIKARWRVCVGAAVHGQSVLSGRHAVASHLLLVHVGVSAIGLRSTHDLTVHVPSVSVVTVVETTKRAGSRELALILGHVVHAIRDWDHAKWVDHVVCGQVAQAIEVVEITLVGEAGGLLSLLLVLLNVSLRVRQVTSSSGVATADRALLEMTLQDITSREGIAAKNTHVRAITGV
ncbi:hypothetical protein FOXYSP1_09819 [Fusarium oxysporum f. sp. phaseoli]